MNPESTTVLETNYQIYESDNSETEKTDDQQEAERDNWDFELTSFVSENAHILVDCPWQPDATMTLSAVTLEWPTPITQENVDSVVAVLRQLLASAVEQIEENASDEPIEPKTIETPEADQEQITPNKNDTETGSIKKVESQPQKTTIAEPSAFATYALPVPIEANQNIPLPYIDSTVIIPPLKPAIIRSSVENDTVIKPKPIKTIVKLKPAQQHEQPEIVHNDTTKFQHHTTKQPLQTLEYQSTFDSYVDFSINPIVEINNVEAPSPITTETKPNTPGSIEPATAKHSNNELDYYTHAELVLAEAVERSEHVEPETTQIVAELIHKIVEVSLGNYPESEEILEIDIDQQDKTVALLAELLDVLEIKYSPELLEALARSMSYEGLIEEIEEFMDENQSTKSSSATRLVRQLVAALTNAKLTAKQAYILGSSAIKHYGIHFPYIEYQLESAPILAENS